MREMIKDSDLKVGLTNGEIKERMNRKYQRGLTNGDVEGGFTNGAVSQSEIGMINGLTNGSINSMANEPILKSINDNKLRRDKKPKKIQKIISVIFIFVMITSSVFIYVNYGDISDTNIDGDYTEWGDMVDIGFAKFGIMQPSHNKFQFAIEKDNIFYGNGDNITETFYIFINDKKSDNGFYLGYDTYEYYIDMYGVKNIIEGARGYQYGDENNTNWAGYHNTYNSYNIKRSNNNSFVEFELYGIQLGLTNISNLEFLIYYFDYEGNYKYSSPQSLENMAVNNQDDTRNDNRDYYFHNLETNILTINTKHSLAYSSFNYNIREIHEKIISDNVVDNEVEVEDEEVNETVETTFEKKVLDKQTKLFIQYEVGVSDIIIQCGGFIINSTANCTLDDIGFILYQINKTVMSCELIGDFGTIIIQKEVTRNSGTISLSDVPINPEPLGSITSMKADEYDVTEQTITVDGVLDEYIWCRIPTDQYYVDVASNDMKILTVRNSTHLFVGVWASEDTNYNAEDSCNIYFDTDNDETTAPDVADKRLQIVGEGTIVYFVGNGAEWSSDTTPDGWDAGQSTTGASLIITYEFIIPISDLNESGEFGIIDTTIGFGVMMYDSRQPSQTSYTWYPDNLYVGGTPTTQYMDKPDTWADLVYGDDFTGTEFADYDMYAQPMSDTITIDGELDESAWITYADNWVIDCNGHVADLYTMRDSTYLYIGWYSRDYDSLSASDFCQIYFDINYDRTEDPEINDRLLQIGDDNVTTCFGDDNEDGVWNSITMPTNWDGKNGATTGNISWEARFTLSVLDASGNFSNVGEKIGFGITVAHVPSVGDSYIMSYPDACEHDFELVGYKYHPESWGDLFYAVPEGDVIIMSGVMFGLVFFVMFKRRKDEKTIMEEY